MSDTGQIPGEGLPENAGMVEQPGVAAPDAYAYLAPSEHVSEDDDLLLMPSPQGAWSDPQTVPAPGQYPEGAARTPLPGQGAYQPQPVAQSYAQQADDAPAQPQGPVQVQVQEPPPRRRPRTRTPPSGRWRSRCPEPAREPMSPAAATPVRST